MSSNTTNYSATAGANNASHLRNSPSSFLGAFLSSTNLGWLQLIIAGLLLELSRRMGIVQAICDLVLELFSVRATFRQSDSSYSQSFSGIYFLLESSHLWYFLRLGSGLAGKPPLMEYVLVFPIDIPYHNNIMPQTDATSILKPHLIWTPVPLLLRWACVLAICEKFHTCLPSQGRCSLLFRAV